MVLDLPGRNPSRWTVSHSGGRQPGEKPQMMEVEEKEGMEDQLVVSIQDRPASSAQKALSMTRGRYIIFRWPPALVHERSPVMHHDRPTLYQRSLLYLPIRSTYLSPHPMPKIFAGLPAGLTGPDVFVGEEDHQNLAEPNTDSTQNHVRHPRTRCRASALYSSTVRTPQAFRSMYRDHSCPSYRSHRL